MSQSFDATDRLCVNTLRTLAVDMIEKAKSGHPGLPLGAAPMAYVLWSRYLKFNPKAPDWHDRDRFVLSAGHGSALLYALLHCFGYDLPLDELKHFRQWGSATPGHPEFGRTPGVEATTGPLGQGVGNAVGMAIAERALAARFNTASNKVIDHYTYALVSEGDLMEGIAYEACSLAGKLQLGKLSFLFDYNHVTLDGPLSMSFEENVQQRFEAAGWQVLDVPDGDTDLEAIAQALEAARAEESRPSLIIVHTTLGYGAPTKAGTSKAHGSPLGPEEAAACKQSLGFDPEQTFVVPAEAKQRFEETVERNEALYSEAQAAFKHWQETEPELASRLEAALKGELPAGWDAGLADFTPGEELATRKASGAVLNVLAERIPELIGGDADLSCSTNTLLKDAGDFDGRTGEGRNLHFGVREHAMAAIANGIAYHGGLRPFVATFFVFSDYMRPSVRLAAMSDLPVIYVWTHDSIGVGEDGPTHEPVEHLMALRAVPNLAVVRPADANETAAAWRFALERKAGPTALVLSRQNLPVLSETADRAREGVARGAYVLSEAEGGAPQLILLATGSEVSVALEAQRLLASEGVAARVVSMPCWEAFEAQPESYRNAVLPPEVEARVAIEAGATLGWWKWIGAKGAVLGLDRFGASAPGKVNFAEFGFTPEHVVEVAKSLL